MDDDEVNDGLAELEQWLHDLHTGAEPTPGRLRRSRLRAEGSAWMPGLTALDDATTVQRMLAAVRAIQRLHTEQRDIAS